jgi:DNA polymerase-3 subunit chi
MQVDFYHLSQPIERVLPVLAEKVVGSGGRLLVVSADAGQRRSLDRLLWEYDAESFLPHAQAGEGDDGAQPILVSAEVSAANGARLVLLADGVWRDEALGFDRALHLFGEENIGAAREAWRGLKERDGVERRYWQQDERGKWRQAA